MHSPIAVKFVLNTGHKTRNLYSAVADSGIKIVYICKMLPFRNAGNEFIIFLAILKADKVSPKLTLNLSLTLNNIFVTLFLFKPRANFTSCLACCNNLKPITAWTLALRIRGQYLNNFARFNLIIKMNDFAVYLSADHFITDGGMNCISKVNNRCSFRKRLNIATRSKYINLIA